VIKFRSFMKNYYINKLI